MILNKNNMKQNKIYISGKISGMEYSDAFSKFEAAEIKLTGMGYHVINPMKIEHDHDQSWESYMRNDIKALCDCNALFALSNWQESRGAKIEVDLATQLGLLVIYE